MKKRGVYWILLCLLPLLLAMTLNPGQIHTPNPSIELNYTDTVEILSGELLTRDGTSIQTYDSSFFKDLSPSSAPGTVWYIELGLILPEKYQFAIQKQDPNPPNARLEDDVVFFEYVNSDAGLNIHLTGSNVLKLTPAANSPTNKTVPESAFAQSTPYNTPFMTTKAARCNYSTGQVIDPRFMLPFESTNSDGSEETEHAIEGLTLREVDPLYVYCNSSEYGPILASFILGYAEDEPTFTVTLDPPVIVDVVRLYTNLSMVSTNTPAQKLYCEVKAQTGTTRSTVDGYNIDGTYSGAYLFDPWVRVPFSDPGKPTTIPVNVTCWNRAGLASFEEVDVPIDLNVKPTIYQVSPEDYTSESAVLLEVRVEKGGTPVEAVKCTFLGNSTPFTTDDGLIHSVDLGKKADGEYAYEVECIIGGGDHVVGDVGFVVDTQAPGQRTLNVPPISCGTGPISASVNVSEYQEEDPNLAGYKFNITNIKGPLVLDSGEAPGPKLTSYLDVLINETYKWSVWPFDLANNRGSLLTGSTKIIDEGEVICDFISPRAIVDINETSLGTIVTINCSDDESGCTETFGYDKYDGHNTTIADCAYATPEALGRGITFYENGTICYQVQDKNANNGSGFRIISVTADIPSSDIHCSNGVFDAGLEADIDCGGNCPLACGEGSNCTLGADCGSGYCNENDTCEPTSCTDLKQGGYETDVDCGGPQCPGCGLNQSCVGSSDCSSSYCPNGTCQPRPGPDPECEADSDCPTGQNCNEGLCGGKSCSTSIDCPSGQNCVSGTCHSGSGTNCTDDTDCTIDELCFDGSCVSAGGGEGLSLWGIILTILGLLIMGGSGYWLYYLHQQRIVERQRFTERSARQAYRPPVGHFSPAQKLALAKRRQGEVAAMKQRKSVQQQRASEKAKERAGLLDTFGEGSGEASESGKEKKPDGMLEAKPTKETQEPKLDEGLGEEFVDVRDLGTKEATHTKKEVPKEAAPKKKDATFSELDELIGDKEKGKGGKNEKKS